MCLQEKVEEISEQSFSSGVDPYQIKDGWVDDISLWPPVEYGNVHNYLIKLLAHIQLKNWKPIRV